jgi:hypothetical protein
LKPHSVIEGLLVALFLLYREQTELN